ncbi:amino acid permease [Trichophyton equinum CBS 127.97]|uniref:Amino acid permease n=1 Tax=Trichophyton equinum (strain ATCC MYA-4606 / CBS 127.97) TaxID=559882 RepID=F2PJN0_TRIEC|nr:amino acid permease [Trichophyton equinum CBS 127.97]
MTLSKAQLSETHAGSQTTSILPEGSAETARQHEMDDDERVLVSLGYKQEFKREFSLWTTFCVSFSILGLLPSYASTMSYGTSKHTAAWLLCKGPGGLYYAAAVLAPAGWGPFAAWITGWSNWMAQVTAAPSVNYGISGMILAAVSVTHPGYVPQPFHTFLLTTSLMIIHGIMSSMSTKWLAELNSYGSTFNIICLILVIIAIPVGTSNVPRFNSSEYVWGTIHNRTSYPDWFAVMMSFLSVIWIMSGYDSPFHLSEECSNANIASPRAIVMTSGIGGIMGWFLQLVVAYTLRDIDEVIDSELGQPWASYVFQVMPTKLGLAILSGTVICGFSMGQACMISASRVTYAYSRDDCFPFSNIWRKINPYTQTPVNAVWFNCVLGILATFLIFAGDVAMGALFSIGGISALIAFSIPIAIRVLFVNQRFRAGPWNLGKYTAFIGIPGVSFVVIMLPIVCFPQVAGSELTLADMNWTCVAYGGPMAGIIFWWMISARKWFKGPKVNLEHAMVSEDEDRATNNSTNSLI